MQEFFANGKLLLTGEYVVLDGAVAIGMPCTLGQHLIVEETSQSENIKWEANLYNNVQWFFVEFTPNNLELIKTNDRGAAETLQTILHSLKELNPTIFAQKSYNFKTKLDFPRDWGLGSSSTLLTLLAKFANVDAFKLSQMTLGGSGYDISCAYLPKLQTYQLTKKDRKVSFKQLNPDITEHMYFVHLNQKQNSREGIKMYRSLPKNERLIKSITDISKEVISCDNLEAFEDLMYVHETLISNHLQIPTVQEKLFPDYSEGIIKSLGAWGGDFVLVTSRNDNLSYFKDNGYDTILPYSKLIVD